MIWDFCSWFVFVYSKAFPVHDRQDYPIRDDDPIELKCLLQATALLISDFTPTVLKLPGQVSEPFCLAFSDNSHELFRILGDITLAIGFRYQRPGSPSRLIRFVSEQGKEPGFSKSGGKLSDSILGF